MAAYEPTEEQFLRDVAKHKMRIHRNDGLYRHLEFCGERGWYHWFEVVTWPNGLIIRGDMKNWAFSRVEDMFTFFRGEKISPRYWQEKLLAGRDDAKEFSINALEAQVVSYLNNMDDEEDDDDSLSQKQRAEIMAELELNVFDRFGDTEEYPALEELFRFKMHGFTFDPMDGPWGRDWSYHYIWCCRAIQWAIQQYDKGQA